MAAIFNQFFGKYEGAPFNLVKKYDDRLEEREYPAYKWVCTKRGPDDKGTLGENGMFFRLFDYISGQNEDKNKIAMTVPVSTWVSVPIDGSEEFREMCFFIGEEFQEKPPKPTNELVFIKERPTMTIFTRTIGGYVKDRKWAEEADHVKKMIKEKEGDIQIDETGYYQTGYDSPIKFINRRNEVWWVKK